MGRPQGVGFSSGGAAGLRILTIRMILSRQPAATYKYTAFAYLCPDHTLTEESRGAKGLRERSSPPATKKVIAQNGSRRVRGAGCRPVKAAGLRKVRL